MQYLIWELLSVEMIDNLLLRFYAEETTEQA